MYSIFLRMPDFSRALASVYISTPVGEETVLSDHVPDIQDVLVIAYKVLVPQFFGFCLELY